MKRLFREKFGQSGSIPSDVWPLSDEAPVNRTTIFRWCKGESIPTPQLFFALVGALNVDPFVLLNPVSGSGFSELYQFLAQAILGANSNKRLRLLFALKAHLGPRDCWPDDNFGEKYYNRKWYRHNEFHDAERAANYYGRLRISVGASVADKVLHFAWRGTPTSTWLPYGFVRSTDSELSLFSYDGRNHKVQLQSGDGEFVVETWFGPGSAHFCIASLDSFAVTTLEDELVHLPTVRFEG